MAIVFSCLLGALGLFQLALAAGAPWGRFAWGGQHAGVLPDRYRVGSAVSALFYVAIAMLALDRSGTLDVVPDGVSRVGMWIVFGLLVLSVPMNGISRSRPERYVMTPVVLVLAGLALLIALGPTDG